MLSHNLDQSVTRDFVLGVRDKESGIQADCLRQRYRSQQDRVVCRATVLKAAERGLGEAAVGSSPDQFCSVVWVLFLPANLPLQPSCCFWDLPNILFMSLFFFCLNHPEFNSVACIKDRGWYAALPPSGMCPTSEKSQRVFFVCGDSWRGFFVNVHSIMNIKIGNSSATRHCPTVSSLVSVSTFVLSNAGKPLWKTRVYPGQRLSDASGNNEFRDVLCVTRADLCEHIIWKIGFKMCFGKNWIFKCKKFDWLEECPFWDDAIPAGYWVCSSTVCSRKAFSVYLGTFEVW